VAEVEGFEELEDVVSDVEVGEFGVKDLEVSVVDVFEHDRRRFRLQIGSESKKKRRR
jgi:hypothetical protein